MRSQNKKTFIEKHQDKTKLDNFFWFIENYLPQKNKRSSHAGLRLDYFESFHIKKIKKLAFVLPKSLSGDLANTKVTFTVGNWAKPYLNFLKRIKLLKKRF